jgi:YbbR domain-containing protein
MALPRLLVHNLAWKIAAIFLATLVWIVVRGGAQTRLKPSAQRPFAQQPVAVMTAADDSRRFRVDPEVVAVRVAGPREEVRQLQPEEVRAFVDLTAVSEARQTHKRVQAFVPAGFTVTSIAPSEVSVQELLPPPSPATVPAP